MHVTHQAALVQLTQAVLAGADVPQVMQQAATVVADTLTVDHCAIWEFLSEGRSVELRAGLGWSNTTLGQAPVAVEAIAPLNITLPGETPVCIPDWLYPGALLQPSLLREHNVIGSLYALLPGQNAPFGIIEVDVTTPRTFSDQDCSFLQAVANVLALAIERIHARQTLEQQVAELASENVRLVTAAQDKAVLEERQRLARDLHDSVTQALYSVTLHTRAAMRLLATGDTTTAAENLRVLQDTAQEALDEMRLLIFELRPPVLEQVGLVAALQARLNAVEGRAGLETRLVVDGFGDIARAVEEALYRIAQEALNNALKHARAHRITVRLWSTPSQVTLEISDDGIGFDVAAAPSSGGFGLRGIGERVAQLNGTLTLQSVPGNGACLRVEIGL